MDDFVSLVIPEPCEHLRHVSTGTMTRIHNVFSADEINDNDPIFKKKLKQLNGEYSTEKPSLALILMESIQLSGWKRQNEPTSSQSSMDGFILVNQG